MPKLKLNPDPTFTASVAIPVPGGTPESVKFTFKHRTREEFQSFIAVSRDRPDVDVVMDVAVAWELSDPFSRESVQALISNYHGAAVAIADTYARELAGAREKNW